MGAGGGGGAADVPPMCDYLISRSSSSSKHVRNVASVFLEVNFGVWKKQEQEVEPLPSLMV